jgi:hypothetical protein
MMKKYLLAVAVASALICGGCATGGSGTKGITGVDITGFPQAAVTLSTTYTASVQPSATASQAVTWTMSGAACTGTPNPCGSFTSSTTSNPVTYQAPATPPSSTFTITAASQVDPTQTGHIVVTVVPITTTIATTPANIGHGLVQQFAAAAAPDNVPQTFTWTCNVSGNPCANFSSNTSGTAVYTASEATCNNCVNLSAVSTIDPTGCTLDPKGCTAAKGSILASRLPNASYAFRFAGYDSSHNPVAVAGSITVNNGAITGVEDENTASGPAQHNITAGSYTPSNLNDNNTNNAGTLAFTTGGAFPNQFQAVLDANGDFQIIESDGHGTGSGVMQKSASTLFNTAAQRYVFGFTGVDSSGKRVGYVGLLPLDGSGNISTGGTLDANDNGSTMNLCGTSPCNVGGSYQYNSGTGVGELTLTTGITQHFDFYVAGGQIKNAPNPLTLYAISTDPINGTHPALSGSIVAQFAGITYDSTVLDGTSVSHVTGVDSSQSSTLVSLIAGDGDGNGNIAQVFDSNNGGTIVQATTKTSSPCTYTTATGGRYVVTLLGTTTSCGGIPFVFYASGSNRGFLLDQSSAAVMTGGMDPQNSNLGAASQLPGAVALATESSATSGVVPFAANFLLTFTGIVAPPTTPPTPPGAVAGTQYPGMHAVSGTYTLSSTNTLMPSLSSVSGTIVLGANANYVFYPIDATHFYMIDVDAGVTDPSVIYGQQ